MKYAIALTVAVLLAVVGVAGVSLAGNADGASLHDHLRHLSAHIHSAGHSSDGHGSLAGLFDESELTSSQLERLVAADRAFAEFHRDGFGSLRELHERLLAEYENGATDAASLRGIVDEQFDRMRQAAYRVTEETMSAMETLDESQRSRVLQHLEGNAPLGGANAI